MIPDYSQISCSYCEQTLQPEGHPRRVSEFFCGDSCETNWHALRIGEKPATPAQSAYALWYRQYR